MSEMEPAGIRLECLRIAVKNNPNLERTPEELVSEADVLVAYVTNRPVQNPIKREISL